MPFFIAMVVALLVITYVPALSLWLPRVFGF
jgi:TRAP-type C4-dicarboxylate transport system permease large subunit